MDLSTQQGKERVGRIIKLVLTYIHYRVKSVASGKRLYNRGNPDWCSVMTWRPRGVKWGEGGLRGREYICMCGYVYIYI